MKWLKAAKILKIIAIKSYFVFLEKLLIIWKSWRSEQIDVSYPVKCLFWFSVRLAKNSNDVEHVIKRLLNTCSSMLRYIVNPQVTKRCHFTCETKFSLVAEYYSTLGDKHVPKLHVNAVCQDGWLDDKTDDSFLSPK